jgi:hypothetical protein
MLEKTVPKNQVEGDPRDRDTTSQAPHASVAIDLPVFENAAAAVRRRPTAAR